MNTNAKTGLTVREAAKYSGKISAEAPIMHGKRSVKSGMMGDGYEDLPCFDPSRTLVLNMDQLPKTSAYNGGIWRRLIVIPFSAKITGS